MPAAEPELLHQFFAESVVRAPEALALVDAQGRHFSYSDLEGYAARVAAALAPHLVGEAVVGLLLPRTEASLFAAQLGVLRAGAAYTALDLSFPDEHAAFILEDAAVRVLLTDRAHAARARQIAPDAVPVIAIDALPDALPSSPEPAGLGERSLAYVIYTSGTTGRPKGVLIEHRGIVNLVASDRERFGLGPGDRVAQGSSPAYDSAVEETWLAFAVGAAVIVLDDEIVRSGPDLADWLRRECITVFCPPPTLLRAMGCRDPERELPELKLLYVGGEALPQDLSDLWSRGRRLENGYGPTECSVTVVRARMSPGRPVVIGRPVRGHRAFVLDEALEPVAPGESGELCIAGPGLARGYLGRPELTAERFPEHSTLGRLYRTGDRVREDAAGDLHYLGRLDAQVKLRGHRIELSAVEAHLAACEGVREAACVVQANGGAPTLVAFLVPERAETPPVFEAVRERLARELPSVMVPARFGLLDALPVTVGGKLDRRSLPALQGPSGATATRVAPRDALEAFLAEVFAAKLGLESPVSIESDFFVELGGDSLRAAEVVSVLRQDARTEALTVRDVYEAPTIAALATRARDAAGASPGGIEEAAEPRPGPFTAGVFQGAVLALGALLGGVVLWLLTFKLFPWLLRWTEVVPFLVLLPFLAFAIFLAWIPVSFALVVFAKKLLVGTYRPGRFPVWGGFYLRHWLMTGVARVLPWGFVSGTVLQTHLLRALGARIGERVHLHRGVDLRQGGWDLLTIGDDVMVSQDAALRLVSLERGHFVVGPVTLEAGSSLHVRAGMSRDSVLGAGSRLGALSWLPEGSRVPAGERWQGVPASRAGPVGPPPPVDRSRDLSPTRHALGLIIASMMFGWVVAIPSLSVFIGLILVHDLDAENVLGWMFATGLDREVVLPLLVALVGLVPIGLVWGALLLRALGEIPTTPISRWSPAYFRIWWKTAGVEAAGRWLSGTLLWPRWLRLAGMKVGRDCEVSSIIDVIPERVSIGAGSFFADGIYLGGPLLHQGTVSPASTHVSEESFLGNHAVLPAGTTLPRGVLLGVCTVASEVDAEEGTSWFGHPPFPLPRREIVEVDRRLTHEPGFLRRFTRWFWELLRFLLPVPGVLVFLLWFKGVAAFERQSTLGELLLIGVPLISIAATLTGPLGILALKWLLLGKVRPGQHPLWSCWCSRWDFLYVAWGQYARGVLSMLEGTPFLAAWLRAMGAKVGRNVVLGGGFAHVVDPDMLRFEDGATVASMFQAHSFEDRVLKIDHVDIRRDASVESASLLFYGADVGAGTRVRPHGVVMKRERLPAHRSYAGVPVVATESGRAED